MPVLSEEEKAIRASPKHDLEKSLSQIEAIENPKLSNSILEDKNPELDSPKMEKEKASTGVQESLKDQEYDPL